MARIQDIDIPHLEFAEAAAPGTPASAIVRLYAKSDGLLYSKDDAGVETVVTGGGGGSATSLQSGRVVRTSADVTTSSTTFVDLTGASITFTTGARKVLLTFTCTAFVNNTAGTAGFDFDIDGSRASGADFGLTGFNQHSTASEAFPVHMSFLTSALTAASHTFKVQWRVGNGAHTGTVQATTASFAYQFSAVELYA